MSRAIAVVVVLAGLAPALGARQVASQTSASAHVNLVAHESGGEVTAPTPVAQYQPAFPTEAAQAGVDGQIELRGVVTMQGTVVNIDVVRSFPEAKTYHLEDEAVRAFSRWQFNPGTINGTPTNVFVTVRFTFPRDRGVMLQPQSQRLGVTGAFMPDDFVTAYPTQEPNLAPARIVHAEEPKYTVAAMRARLQGEVAVEAVIDGAGAVTAVRVLKSVDPDLDQQAIQAMYAWKFTPGTLSGKPVATRQAFILTFRLH